MIEPEDIEQQEHRLMIEREEIAEREAIEVMRAFFEIVAERSGPWLYRMGDGEGGWMHQVLDEALATAGFVPMPRVPPKYRRGHISGPLRRQVFERDGYRCRGCKDWHDLTVDHVIPVSAGGESVFDNLQTLCKSCNSKKGARLPELADAAHPRLPSG